MVGHVGIAEFCVALAGDGVERLLALCGRIAADITEAFVARGSRQQQHRLISALDLESVAARLRALVQAKVSDDLLIVLHSSDFHWLLTAINNGIERDGALQGVNVAATTALAEAIDMPVIASGGVSSLDDIAALMAVAHHGIEGVICGRALYDGHIDPKSALALLAGEAVAPC